MTPAVSLGDIRVRVENGTTVPGLAARVAANLQRPGFTISEVGDVPNQELHGYRDREHAGPSGGVGRGAQALGSNAATACISPIAAPADERTDVTIVHGRDIINSKP